MNNQDVIQTARRLCVGIKGCPDAEDEDTDGYGYGSIDIAEILSAEVLRLRALIQKEQP